MNAVFTYFKNNWFLLMTGSLFVGWFVYLTFEGNQLCDCEKTETYRDGTARRHSTGVGYYRYYHK